jgi:hypothetical protein
MSKRSPIQLALALCLVIVTLTLSLFFFTSAAVRETRRTAVGFVESMKETFNFTPRVTVDRTVIVQESMPVLELVGRKQRFDHRMKWSSTRFGSTKEIVLDGVFTASAGFDLHEPFSVEFDSRKHTVLIRHPRPRVLSMQLENVKTSQDSGWLNYITDADRTEVLNRFTADARSAVEKTPLLQETVGDLRKQLGEMLSKSGFKVEFKEDTTPTIPPREGR